MQLVVPRAVSAAVRTEITIWMMTLHISLFFMIFLFFYVPLPGNKGNEGNFYSLTHRVSLSAISFISVGLFLIDFLSESQNSPIL